MVKILSVTDVITNSSTEVFVMKSHDRCPNEVLDWLLSNTEGGYTTPEDLRVDRGVLKDLIEYGYLVDPGDQGSMDWYLIREVFVKPEKRWLDSDWVEHREEIPGGPEITKAWEDYLIQERDRINTEYHQRNGGLFWRYNPVELRPDGHCINPCLHPEELPTGFVTEFLSQYSGPIPGTAQVPRDMSSDGYIGKTGFMSISGNSISSRDIDRILRELDCTTWHLG